VYRPELLVQPEDVAPSGRKRAGAAANRGSHRDSLAPHEEPNDAPVPPPLGAFGLSGGSLITSFSISSGNFTLGIGRVIFAQ
jgi:hypothetical protein